MAFRPSTRRTRKDNIVDLNLAPIMSLFVALIPMLLITAVFQRVGIVNLFLPTAEDALLQDAPLPADEQFTLAVTVTVQGITLKRDDRTIFQENMGDDLNLAGLVAALKVVKKEVPGKRDAVLLLDGSILYDTIIQVMDAMRESEGEELFPDISLADRVVELM